MRPLPETAVLLEQMSEVDPGWRGDVDRLVRQVAHAVRSCVAAAVTSQWDGLTCAYLAEPTAVGTDVGLARAQSRAEATVTLPLLRHGFYGNFLTVYAERHHDLRDGLTDLLRITGARTYLATWDSDLACAELARARSGPQSLLDDRDIAVAVDTLATRHDWSFDRADQHLSDLARASDVSVVQMARVVIALT